MDTYITDKEQVEMIRKWWRENGKFTIISIIVVVVLSFGWRYWQNNQAQKAANASVIYEQMLTHESNNQISQAELDATSLITNYAKTPYAALGAFISALNSINANNLDAAIQRYDWVMLNANSKDFIQIAKIRKARVLLALNKYDDAITTLSKVEADAYLPLIKELRGDILLAKGDKQGARSAYQNALNALRKDAPNRNFLQIKYDQLK